MENYWILISLLLSVEGTLTKGETNESLSVLLIYSMFPSHYFPLLSLGVELSQRGHNVTMVGPTLEDYEHLPELAKSNGIVYIQSSYLPKSTYNAFKMNAQHSENTSVFRIVYNLTRFLFEEHDVENYLIGLRKSIDKLNSSNYDYVIVESAAFHLLFYVQKKWNTDNIMLVAVLVETMPRYTIPWPYPRRFSPFYDNMTFVERFINTLVFAPFDTILFKILFGLTAEKEQNMEFDIESALLGIPVLVNSVIGIEYPKTILPLHHYVGPMLLPVAPPLDSTLVNWLNKHSQSIIYISMGTTGVISENTALSFLKLSESYKVVWSIHKSNQEVLNALDINEEQVFISSWISQYTLLKEARVSLAVLHCGLNGVQESLYNGIPIVCVPFGADQYNIARLLVYWKLGTYISPDSITPYKMIDTVQLILNDPMYKYNAYRLSRIFRSAGGVKRGADLVELYADIGYTHGVPSFLRSQWGFVEYYNVDVWALIIFLLICFIWSCKKLCRYICCNCCCCCNQPHDDKVKND